MQKTEEKQVQSEKPQLTVAKVQEEMVLPKRKVEVKQSDFAEVSLAQQEMILSNQELENKFGYYNEIRRKTLGIINSLELNVIDKTNLDQIVQDCVIKAPNYWLTYAMSALSYWYMDNKSASERFLSKALECNDSKTSLFFALICASSFRDSASSKWIKRYLNQVDPMKVNQEVILIIDAISSGIFGEQAKSMCIVKTKKWLSIIEKDQQAVDNAKDLWIDYYDKNIEVSSGNNFPYLEKYSSDFPKVIEVTSMSKTNDNIFDKFKCIMEHDSKRKINISAMIEQLINNDSEEENQIKNKISSISKSISQDANNNYNEYNTLLYLMSYLIINDSIFSSNESKKLMLSLIKNIILESYQEFKEVKMSDSLPAITIQIDDWTALTTDASNEKEILKSLNNHFEPTVIGAIKESGYFSPLSIIIPIVFVVLSVAFKDNLIISIIFCIFAGLFIAYSFYQTDKKKKEQKSKNGEFTDEIESLLNNIMAEVVDYSRVWKISNDKYNELHNYLNNLNEQNFMNKKEIK